MRYLSFDQKNISYFMIDKLSQQHDKKQFEYRFYVGCCAIIYHNDAMHQMRFISFHLKKFIIFFSFVVV